MLENKMVNMHAADLLTNRVRLTPEKEAIYDVDNNVRYTYKQFNERVNRAANFLTNKLGIAKGDRVSFYAFNSIAYLDVLYAVGKIGAIIAPLNWRLTVSELVYITNDSAPKAILVGPEWVDQFNELLKETNISKIVTLEGAKIEGAFNYDEELEKASPQEPLRPADLNGEDTYCIMYTSGTTGRPKGAMIPQRQVLWNVINLPASWGLNENDTTLIFLPLFHAGGLFGYLTPILYVGGKIVLIKTFDANETLKLLETENCTVQLGVPTIYQIWYDCDYFKKVDLSKMNYFIVGGAPIPKPLMEAWGKEKNITFRQGYGLTEVGPNCFSMTNEDAKEKIGSIGKPIFHSQIRLVDKDRKDVPVGKAGEIIINGPHVCKGYWKNPEATKKVLIDGWFHTGDIARMDKDGFFYISGRAKEMIISGGENIYCAEVETVFNDHEAVKQCALIGKPHEKWGEVGILVVELKQDKIATKEELIEFSQKYLAKYKIPRELKIVDKMPEVTLGKVDKKTLKEKYGAIKNIGLDN